MDNRLHPVLEHMLENIFYVCERLKDKDLSEDKVDRYHSMLDAEIDRVKGFVNADTLKEGLGIALGKNLPA